MKDKSQIDYKGLFDRFADNVWLEDTATPRWEGDAPKKQNIYFGCNYEDIPTIIIKWSEKGRGFGEYVFQWKDDKMVCHNECDSKEAIKRVLCRMVDQCTLTEVNKR
jgi:hypothetical protein